MPQLKDHMRRAGFSARRHGGHIRRLQNEESGRARARSGRRHIHDHRNTRAQNRAHHGAHRVHQAARRVHLDQQRAGSVGVGARRAPASAHPRSPAEWCHPAPACRQPAAARRHGASKRESQQRSTKPPQSARSWPNRLFATSPSHGSPLSRGTRTWDSLPCERLVTASAMARHLESRAVLPTPLTRFPVLASICRIKSCAAGLAGSSFSASPASVVRFGPETRPQDPAAPAPGTHPPRAPVPARHALPCAPPSASPLRSRTSARPACACALLPSAATAA